MPNMSTILYIYAALLLIGGIFGYMKAKSSPSLIAGVVSAILAAFAGYLLPSHARTALGLAAIVSLALTIFFVRRYTATKLPMPSLPMAIISAIVFVLAALELMKRMSAHTS